MARNDPFEADLHGLKPEKLVLLMRTLNERAKKLNEARRQSKMAAEKSTCPVEGFYREIGSQVRLKLYDLSSH